MRRQGIWAIEQVWSDEQRLVLLTTVLRHEPSDANRSSAAAGLLRALGRAPDDARIPDYRSALQALESSDADVRDRMLGTLGL